MAVGDTYYDTKIETFDDFYETEKEVDYGVLTPFQFRGDKPEETLLEWLVEMDELNMRSARSRFRVYRRNMDLYKGIHWKGDVSTKRNPKQSVNFVFEMTEAKVSQLSSRKIGFQAIPRHNEQTDVNNARAAKMLLSERCRQIGFDEMNAQADRTMMQLGQSYFHVCWDDTAGGLHPQFKQLEKLGGAALKKVQKKLGKDSIYIGDVDVTVMGANRVYPELGKKELHKDVDYVDVVDREHIDALKMMYPGVADDLTSSDIDEFNWEINDHAGKDNFVVVHTFYHRKTKWLPEGKMIKWTKDAILEEGPLPYDHGMIPLVAGKDIEVYEEFFGRSNYSNIYNLQRFYNLIQSAQARDYSIASAPKWMVPKGSVKPTTVNNELSIMEFTGPMMPKLVSHNPTSSQGFELQDRMESKMAKIMRVGAMERGEVPSGVTANSALRFLDEQENQRLSTTIANRNKRIVDTLNMMLCVMSQYYTPTDGRTVRALGEDNGYLVKDFSKTDFTKVYSVQLEKASALPDTKTGKIATIVDLNQVTQTDPLFKRDEIIDMLDLGLDKAFVNRSTAGINAARQILQDILEGEEVGEPQMYDSLDIHYKVFTEALEENWFKQRVDPNIQLILAERVKTIEGLMWMRAKNNAKFAQEVGMMDKYPIYFTPPIPISQIIQQHMMAPQAGPGGAPTTDHIEVDKEQGQ